MGEQAQGQAGADRAIGRPGPAARMTGPEPSPRPRPSVLIPPVSGNSQGSVSAPASPVPAAPVPSGPVPGAGSPGGSSDGARNSAPAAPAARAPQPVAPTSVTPSPQPPGPAQYQSQPGQAQPTRPVAQPVPQGVPAQPSSGRGQAARVARTAVQPSLGPRSARLYVTHVDPWSVMKQAFLLSLAMAVVILVASATLWFALESAGVIDAITRTATDVGGESVAGVTSFLDFSKMMGLALVLAGIETVLLTAMATLFAFLYNLAVGIGGGLEITLSEED